MATSWGNKLKTAIYGRSHGPALGLVMEGLPAGKSIDLEKLQAFMNRRRPGTGALTTRRKEDDTPIFLSGLDNGKTTGEALRAVIKNTDSRSKDYSAIAYTPRPGHADLAAWYKWGGAEDMAGGGRFSGRLTAPLCLGGGIALQLLAEKGIYIAAHLFSVGAVEDEHFPLLPDKQLFGKVTAKTLPVINDGRGSLMELLIKQAAQEGDSIGGSIECAAIGVPPGLGDAGFDGVESRLAPGLFGIPGVKGVEFGLGFEASAAHGSEANDPIILRNGRPALESNCCGGILGGITCAAPLIFRVAMKPTPSIAKPQRTVDLKAMEQVTIEISGRHDPCIALRAVPVVEAVAALGILDLLLEEGKYD